MASQEGDGMGRGITIQYLPRIRGKVFQMFFDKSEIGGIGVLTETVP